MKSDFENALRKCVEQYIGQGIFDGAVILTGNADEDTFCAAIGTADRVSGRPMARDTVFDVSSVTKPVATATCALLLAEEGRLDLNTSFTEYLPEFNGRLIEPISVRAMATHYSGLKQDYPRGVPADELLNHILQSSAVQPPWTEYNYSCACYDMLGMIIEKISGKPLAEFAKERLFLPLGMNDSSWGYPLKSQVGRLFVHNRCVNSDHRVVFDMWARVFQPRAIGNAGLFTTATDLAIYSRMILNRGRGLFKTNIVEEEMLRNFAPLGKTPRSFGWNLDSRFRPAGFSNKFIYHSGSSGQSLWIDYGRGCFIIILTNLFGEHDAGIQARLQIANLFP